MKKILVEIEADFEITYDKCIAISENAETICLEHNKAVDKFKKDLETYRLKQLEIEQSAEYRAFDKKRKEFASFYRDECKKLDRDLSLSKEQRRKAKHVLQDNNGFDSKELDLIYAKYPNPYPKMEESEITKLLSSLYIEPDTKVFCSNITIL